MSGERWVTETLHDGLRCAFRADEVIYEEETEHQHLVIFENVKFGRVMSLDGITQVTEKDEFVYHEMMSHVPILAHGNAKKVLIIGGGDGGVLREVLRHKTVEKCTMVEIDRSVVDMCVEYLPMISAGAFDDPRTDLVIADGAKFVAETDERYDVVIVDSTDPVGPGAILFSEEFYKNAKRCMAGGGIIVTQNGVPFLQGDELTGTMGAFAKLFASRSCYLATIPTYVFGAMALGWGSDNEALLDVPVEVLQERFAKLEGETLYYTPEVHKGAFALPPYVKRFMG
ncbi:polyamine aminopropyltransferase [Tepidicaulis sp. LMO-SS28]|uniref:polyamine aminopropyltransferase n=1 Tax=Tepidicaulis sp. LMO-SS28 TaxID=3447455 RepID=UPI003EE1F3DB